MHKPVLLQEILEIFNPQPGETYIDATVNGGGHTRVLLEKVGPRGGVIGIDWDCELVQDLKKKFPKYNNLKLVCDSYVNLKHITRTNKLDAASGILFDLGFSSYHIEESGRGFSFLRNEPLDMRYNPKTNELTAEKIINTWPRSAVETILREYGEERYAGRLASRIIQERRLQKITNTAQLVKIISDSIPRSRQRNSIHPATRTFQALRIAVNNELENLKLGLSGAIPLLQRSGKVIVISFHSLEDRIVKNFFREEAKRGVLKVLNPKPIRAKSGEIKLNPRSRSAKLRAAQRI
ncbi:MAG: 16S rRNA (cytosine(1402)-N(4))-methyltransferase RsmH [Candidatus Sungiibacteriota bacterium]|uniref:Ribosomal RNA small subunit methyltransferase H n=1 Tax=Candidatus Sungiibacteriota bacterium TaxID=2750080 RepID=A0A7T5UQN3_9BACT|nr:MAG: 16S rRNA (cytosine(1402)-N(4))-methyltransferase RsmH [Candidatus Sungbacteria bacterium]